MTGMALQHEDIREVISWEDARDNFGKAAKFGIDSPTLPGSRTRRSVPAISS